MNSALETRGLLRTFGDFTAVDGIDLLVPTGSFYGFLGPNGAGKSTTIKCLTGLLRPTAGEIRVLGLDPRTQAVEIKRQVGVVPEDQGLFDRLSGRETLRFIGRVHGLGSSVIQSRSDELFTLMALSDDADALVVDYSHGMRKKLSLAASLIASPRMLFLDEPFEGIDAVASRQIKNLLASYVKGGGTVFLTSHILEIVEGLCDQIGVIHHGKLVTQGSLSDLQSGRRGVSLEKIFLQLVGASEDDSTEGLEWLSR